MILYSFQSYGLFFFTVIPTIVPREKLKKRNGMLSKFKSDNKNQEINQLINQSTNQSN